MNLLLLLPLGLGALLALAIPLLIHLARREQQQPTVFAALRWLQARARPRRRIRFDEWPLLLVRLLLLAVLALWLARPALTGVPDLTPWTVVAPGIADAQVRAIVDRGEGESRWLADGFPPLSEAPPASVPPIASLLRQLDATLPEAARLTVLVPEHLGGLDGERPRLARSVEWRVLPGASPEVESQPEPLRLIARHDDGHAPAMRYLRAAVIALSAQDVDSNRAGNGNADSESAMFSAGPAALPLPAGNGPLAWFFTGPVPADVSRWAEAGGDVLLPVDAAIAFPAGRVFVPWRDADGAALIEAATFGQGRIFRFTRALDPATMPQLLDADFPTRLQQLFDTTPLPSRAQAALHTPLAGAAIPMQPPRDLQPWIAVLVALLALLERWMATSRRREAQA